MLNLTQQRLENQRITHHDAQTPAQLLDLIGPMQAQDYPQTKWAVGARLPDCSDAAVERAFADRSILRTWLFRGTLHTVSAADVYWLLDLVAPRLLSSVSGRKKQLGLDGPVMSRALELLETMLDGGLSLTRENILENMAFAGLHLNSHQVYHVLHQAALEQRVCFGARQGSSFTYNSLASWAPARRRRPREESLALLTLRYFSTRGPATLQDFVWWSGLTLKEAKTGLENVKNHLECYKNEERELWFSNNPKTAGQKRVQRLFLLPAYDEYILGYRHRNDFLDPADTSVVVYSNGLFHPMIVLDGQIIGIWKRSVKKDRVEIEPRTFQPLNEELHALLKEETRRYERFLFGL